MHQNLWKDLLYKEDISSLPPVQLYNQTTSNNDNDKHNNNEPMVVQVIDSNIPLPSTSTPKTAFDIMMQAS